MTYDQAIRALNKAAYDAARTALREGRSVVPELKRVCAVTDQLVDEQ
jgi:hypothetical protein